MIVLLSPSKEKLSEVSSDALDNFIFMEEFVEIAEKLKKLSVEELKAMYKSSSAIAEENSNRFQNLLELVDSGEVNSAIHTYNGLQFRNMEVENFSKEDLNFMNEHFIILSALYGALKPLDGIAPYRLDLNNPLSVGEFKNLYEYWGDKIYSYVVDRGDEILCLASEEYKKLVSKYVKDKSALVEVKFGIDDGEKIKYHATTSKIWKGKLCKYIVENRIEKIEDIVDFSEDRFLYDESLSNERLYVFVKR